MFMKTLLCMALTSLLLLGSCTNSMKQGASVSKSKPDTEKADAENNPDLSFLLSMSFEEASAISPQKLVVSPRVSIAADTIDVLSTRADGTPRRIRAKGHVYLQVGEDEQAHMLCQEAFISGDEVILRGKPIVQRGASTVEGMADSTVFYLLGKNLRAIGLHKVTTQNDIGSIASMGPWENTANPLLPPLAEGSVPDAIRDELRKASEAETLHQQALKTDPAPPMTAPQ